jgi:hypothetical protein
MRERVGTIATGFVFIASVLIGGGFIGSVAWAQDAAPPSLQDQLSAQYKMVKMGSDTSGASMVDEGTILNIKKGGILGVPYTDANVVPTKYQDGTIHSPTGLQMVTRKSILGKFGKEQTTRLFKSGEKVYPAKITVNLNKDTVSLAIVACDSCNKTDPPTFYKAEVVFQFAKGALATTSVPKVEDTIADVFSADQGGGDSQQGQDSQSGQNQQGGDQQGGNQAQQAQQPAQPAAQPQAPQSIEKGQTIDQVVAAWGQPQKIVNLGTKQIYIYQDAKITFLNGKVSDVQ